MQADIQFKEAMIDIGLEPPDQIIPDGDLHRFGKNKNGWYVFHHDNIPAGAFGDWKTGLSDTWKEDREYSPEEKTAFKQRMDAIIKQREVKQQKRQIEAKQACQNKWEQASNIINHDYLNDKQVKAYGLKQSGDQLLIPVRINRELTSLQTITPTGEKRFHPGGAIVGGYHAFGELTDIMLIGEGYATLSSAHEATGYCSVAAFNAGNLKAVAESIREKFPDKTIFILADNDQFTEGNPGITKSTEAALSIGAYVAIPEFKDTSSKPSDFNDLHVLEGLETVKKQIESALNTEPKEAKETPEETIQRLSKLTLLEFTTTKKSEAEQLEISVGDLVKLVNEAKKRSDQPEAKGRSIELYEPELWPEPVNGAEVLTEAFNHIDRHMVINNVDIYACVLWAVHTYIFKLFSHTPRLIVTAPDAECGKTLLMTHMVGNLINKPLPIENMKPAPFFRLAEEYNPTYLIDEGDVFLNTDSDLLSGFNNGWEPHGGVIRCIGDDFEPRLFSTHCPIALAGIELQKKLPNTTISRSVVISLDRATSNEISDRNIYNAKLHKKGLLETGRKIARWCSDNKKAIYNCKPTLPNGVRNRLADKWNPLFAIAEIAGGDWIEYAKLALKGQIDLSEPSKALQLLADIKEVIDSTGNIHTETLIYRLSTLEDSPWKEYNFREYDIDRKRITSRQIANLLKKYNLESKPVRATGKLLKGYHRDDLERVFNRYLLNKPHTTELGVTGLQINDTKAYSDIERVTKESNVTLEKPLKTKPSNESYPVTHKTTLPEDKTQKEYEF